MIIEVIGRIGSTLMDSFEVTKACGHVVFYGMSGGNPKAVGEFSNNIYSQWD